MTRQLNRIASFVALLCVALASCSKDAATEPTPAPSEGVIRIGSSRIGVAGEGGEAGTKAVSGTTDALDGIYFYLKNFSTATLQSDMSGGSTATGNRAGDAAGAITWTSTPAPLYDKKTNYYTHLVGCYPGSGAGVTTSAESVAWTIDGKTDILVTRRFSAGTYAVPSTSSMAFQHCLAALEVVVRAQEGTSTEYLNLFWGSITKIELLNTATTATYKPSQAGAALLEFSTTTADMPLLKGASYQDAFTTMEIPAFGSADASAVAASGMFAPSTGTFTLRIHSTMGPPVDVTVQLKSGSTNKNFEAGLKHTVTLILDAPDRMVRVADTQITPWGTGGENGGSVIPPAQTKTPALGFLDWNYSGLVKTGSFSGGTYTIPVFTLGSYNSYTTASNGAKFLAISDIIASERPYICLEVAESEEVGAEEPGWFVTGVDTGGKGNPDGTGGTEVQTAIALADWATAYAACKAKTTDGGGWRLPRASELMQMKMNLTELNKTSGFIKFYNLSKWTWRPPYTDSYGRPQAGYWYETVYNAENSYWTATEGGITGTAWMLRMSGGNTMRPTQKTEYYHVRCVRETL